MDNTLNKYAASINYEMLSELVKAIYIADKYRKNTLRIRRLLEQSPITKNNGKQLVSSITGENLICMVDDTYPIGYRINPDIVV